MQAVAGDFCELHQTVEFTKNLVAIRTDLFFLGEIVNRNVCLTFLFPARY
jgi:hypothetical protein